MSGLNKVMLIGRLGREPETRWFEGGKAMCKLSVATSERYEDQTGQWHERTEWHVVILWRELAEAADAKLCKGDRVYVEGRLKSRTWLDDHGQQHRATEVMGDRLDRLGSEAEEEKKGKPNDSASPRGPHPIDTSSIPL